MIEIENLATLKKRVQPFLWGEKVLIWIFSIRSGTGTGFNWKTLALHHFYSLFILLWLNSDFRPLILLESNFHKKHSRAREDGSLLKCFSPFSACCLYLIHACRLNVLLIRAIHIHSNENDSPMDSKRSQNGERALEEYRLSSHTHHREEDAERSFLVQSARNWWGLKIILSHAPSQIEFNFFSSVNF